MRKMHLLLIHEIFVTPEEGGGTRHYELSKFLVRFGHKVTVVASNVNYLSSKRKTKKREEKEGIEVLYARTLSSVHKSFLSRAIAFLFFSVSSFFRAWSVKDVDIVMGTSPPLFQAVTSLLVAKLKGKKFVYEVRDLWIDFAEELGIIKNRVILNLLRSAEKVLYKKADLIVVNSPGFIPYVSMHVPREKIALIPNGVDTKDFSIALEKDMELKKRFKLDDKFVVMYAGNLGVANDIDNILGTAQLLKDFKDIVFILAGGGIRRDEIKKKIETEKIENILLLDLVSKKEVPRLFSIADVCLATIKNTPLLQVVYPNKVFDYMASGKPVIATIGGAVKDILEESNGGIYISPGQPEELKKAILNYYFNRELVLIHGRNARMYVIEHFERGKIAKELEKVLLKLIE